MSEPETFGLIEIAAMVSPTELAQIVTDMIGAAKYALDSECDLSDSVARDMEADLERIRDDLNVPENLKDDASELLGRIRLAN